MGVVWAFARSRWGVGLRTRRSLERRRDRGIRRLLSDRLPRAARYAHGYTSLGEIPPVDKAAVLGDFAGCNVLGVTLDQALEVARRAERARDFSELLPGGVTVGLSSGTSGRPGVFLVDAGERAEWAGTVLGRLLDRRSVAQLFMPWRAPLRVTFCLRANSTLYESVASRRLRFDFVDLVAAFDEVCTAVGRGRPDVLVAPASVLAELARAAQRGSLSIAPRVVVSVAEVLDPDDGDLIAQVWGTRPRRVYQATEGLLAIDCAHGRLHLNEPAVLIERDWLDGAGRRFTPIVTDLERRTQLVVRYRLDDVLIASEAPPACPCRNPAAVIEQVEGRADEVIELPASDGAVVRVFPDVLRRAMALALADTKHEDAGDWRIRWAPGEIAVRLKPGAESATEPAADRVRAALGDLFATVGAQPPEVRFEEWVDPPRGEKLVRIRRRDSARSDAERAGADGR